MKKSLIILFFLIAISPLFSSPGSSILSIGAEYSLATWDIQDDSLPGLNFTVYAFLPNHKVGIFQNMGLDLPFQSLDEFDFSIQWGYLAGPGFLLYQGKVLSVYTGAGIHAFLRYDYREKYSIFHAFGGIGGDLGIQLDLGKRFSLSLGFRVTFDFIDWIWEKAEYSSASGRIDGFFRLWLTPYIGFYF